jgi:hypothetical protein
MDLTNADFVRDLGMARDYIGYALSALADEHEGNFKFYVGEAAALVATVRQQAEAM